jgi:hypothetical protein
MPVAAKLVCHRRCAANVGQNKPRAELSAHRGALAPMPLAPPAISTVLPASENGLVASSAMNASSLGSDF